MNLLTGLILRHPRKIIGLWIAVICAGAYLAVALNGRLFNSGYSVPGSQSAHAALVEQHTFPHPSAAQAFIALTANHPAAAALEQSATVIKAHVTHIRGVVLTGSEFDAPNSQSILLPVALAGTLGATQRLSEQLQEQVGHLTSHGVHATVVGQAAVYNRYGVISRQSLQRSALLSAPPTLVLLAIAFLSAAAILPLALAVASLAATFAALYVITLITTLSIFAEDTALVLGLGLSIDFALFMVIRIREARADEATTEDAITHAMNTTGRAVVVSGLTVATSLAGLFVVDIGLLSSIAAGSIVAVALAATAAITLLPAVLTVVGERLDGFALAGIPAIATRPLMWQRLARAVVRRRVIVAATTIPLLLLCAWPATKLTVSMKTFNILPKSDPVRHAAEQITQDFGPGFDGPVVVLTRSTTSEAERALEGQPGFAGVGFPEAGSAGWVRTFMVLKTRPDSAAAQNDVRILRANLTRRFGKDALVGGPTSEAVDFIARVDGRTPLVLALIALAEILLLTILFRAPVVAIKAALTTILSVATTLGLLTLIFGSGNLGFFVPLTLVGVIFGLSTDYEVFLLARIREEYLNSRENRASIVRGVVATGRSITLAGVTMSIVFFAFAISPLETFTQLGVGMGLAVLLDVVVIRGLLVPATMALIGDVNWWWPRRGRAAVSVPAQVTD